MKTSPAGLALLKQFEGFVGRMYHCSAGVATIGYGHVIGAKEAHLLRAQLSEAQASALLATDLLRYEGYVRAAVPGPLSAHEYDALVSFTYNLGGGALKKSSLLRLINSGSREPAAIRRAFGLWRNVNGKPSASILARRMREADHFLKP